MRPDEPADLVPDEGLTAHEQVSASVDGDESSAGDTGGSPGRRLVVGKGVVRRVDDERGNRDLLQRVVLHVRVGEDPVKYRPLPPRPDRKEAIHEVPDRLPL